MTTHSSEEVTHPEDVRCLCGHTVTHHGESGCDVYVRPEIGGSGSCCTRTAATVLTEAQQRFRNEGEGQ